MSVRTVRAVALLFAVALLWAAVPVFAALPQYTVKRTTGKIIVDGVLDEGDWAAAESAGDFVFPWWTSGEKEQTEAKLLWDDEFLYVSFVCQDNYIGAKIYTSNAATYNDDTVELFWNPSPPTDTTYYQFEINCIGNLLSAFKPSKSTKQIAYPPHIGRRIAGTLTTDSATPTDTDSLWIVEVAIRFTDYQEKTRSASTPIIPQDGNQWRIGLNRCGGYKNAQYSQWSSSGTASANFHVASKFGYITFSDSLVRTADAVLEEVSALPSGLKIQNACPNPFNPSTSVEFVLPSAGQASMVVYDLTGRKVRTLVDGALSAGTHTVVWNGRDERGSAVSSGTYLVRLRAGNHAASRKILLLK